jgi:hypothetical protein
MATTIHHFRLASGAGSLGPSWGETGLALAGVSLFRRTDNGFAPRPIDELEALLKAAYQRDLDASTVRGLGVAANALNQGDIGRAMIAALHLRLPDLSWEAASRIAKVDERLAKSYNAEQPRDWRGRWTSEGGGAAEFEADPKATKPAPLRSEVSAHQAESGEETEPSEGDNNPPFGRPSGPIVDPVLGAPPKVPEGWDHPPEMVDVCAGDAFSDAAGWDTLAPADHSSRPDHSGVAARQEAGLAALCPEGRQRPNLAGLRSERGLPATTGL